jgi:peptidyl-tRNA hydrolase, PTH1 family
MAFFRRGGGADPDRWVIVGLGNPGAQYEDTRHNAGAMVIHRLAERMGSKLKAHKSGALAAEGMLEGEKVVVARPASYMNESGRHVRALLDFYKTPLERFILVQDEIDIPFGDVRLKLGGGTAGHNGLKSVASHLGSKDFMRIRVGVGRPPGSKAAAGHVLQRFSGAERSELPDLIDRSADAVERVLEAGPERAMNEFNTR